MRSTSPRSRPLQPPSGAAARGLTAYAIVRHNGVDLGKVEFTGALPLRDV